jgi:hypothetical protein
MKPRRRILVWALAILAGPLLAEFPVHDAANAAAEIWVAPTGDDAAEATREQPMASLGMALRKARNLRRLHDPAAADGIRIILRDGIYPLKDTVRMRPEDSGTPASPTVIEAAPNEKPVLSGGVVLSGWRKLEEPIDGLPAAAVGNVWAASAPTFQGRTLELRQLWVGGKKAIRARTPDGATMARLVSWDREAQVAGIPADLVAGLPANPSGHEMIVMQQWEIAILRVRSIAVEGQEAKLTFHDPESAIEFEHPWPQPILPPQGGGAFFLAGAPAFLDQPGEWCQTASGGTVLYWPREGEDLNRDPAIAPALGSLVEVAGTPDRPVSHLVFQGIGFEHASWQQPSLTGHVPLQAGMRLLEGYKLRPKGTADWRGLDNQDWLERLPASVTVRGADNIRFERCRFARLAAAGLDFVSGTHDNLIEGCLFRDIGGNGIQMGSFQDGPAETHLPYDPADAREVCARERIANNLLTDIANEDWGCVAILVGYAREVAIEHNRIDDTSYSGISLGWGWTRTLNCMRNNRVHANRMSRIATRMCDTAGVYTLSAQPGTVISENRVDPIQISPYVDRLEHWFYYYTDEGSSYMLIRDNWCPEPKFLQNANGPGNIWENNGPMVSDRIKNAAGLEPPFKDLLAEAGITE